MQQDGSSSVEEILESIKKVIARDSQANAIIERPVHENDTTDGSTDDSEADMPPEPAYEDEAEEILDLGADSIVEEETGEPDPVSEADESPLINASARNSMRDNLAALAMLAEPGVPPQIVRTGETSLEGLARDLLRPMLAEWLDANLPDMVETLVKTEIARIGGKRS